eukprot:TRINITY_DN15022_c0_g1_i11.p1 TRINITY_DN15022_c0_g1~~TRINITY_DN15022_c0_g1_i11.p1  ORF type:complete len:110 (+),score=8.10 TRINITY_DN15022_c0_g1_i11:547-876(+)
MFQLQEYTAQGVSSMAQLVNWCLKWVQDSKVQHRIPSQDSLRIQQLLCCLQLDSMPGVYALVFFISIYPVQRNHRSQCQPWECRLIVLTIELLQHTEGILIFVYPPSAH